MIHIYNSCRNVSPNLKLFSRCQRNRWISLGKSSKCSKNDDKSVSVKEKPKGKDKKEYPEEPTTCCMSGCANCVWLEYAEKLSEYYRDGGEKAIKEINEKVTDPNVKAFLLHELRMRNKK